MRKTISLKNKNVRYFYRKLIYPFMREAKIKEILTFLQRSNELKAVPRYGVSMRHDQDTVAEHSWRLTLMAFIIASECKIKLNLNRAMALALIHDLAESKTGDIDAYTVLSGHKTREEKIVEEEKAMKGITEGLSFGDRIMNLWQEYEDQKTVESKFIRALDKIEAFLHIAERGVNAYLPKEFHSDYADKAVAAFDEATRHFPEVKDLLDMVKKDLKTQFERVGVRWLEGEPKPAS